MPPPVATCTLRLMRAIGLPTPVEVSGPFARSSAVGAGGAGLLELSALFARVFILRDTQPSRSFDLSDNH